MRINGLTCRSTGNHAMNRVSTQKMCPPASSTPRQTRCAQNVDHLAHNTPFSAFFDEVVCTLGTTPPHVGTSPPPIGGIDIMRGATRRQPAPHAANPHRCWSEGHRRDRRARLRPPWAAGPGRTSSRRTKPHVNTPGPTGVKGAGGAGGSGCGACGRRRGLAGLRADAPSQRLAARTARGRAAAHGRRKQPGPTKPSGARNTRGATSKALRAAAHGRTKQPGPTRRPEHR